MLLSQLRHSTVLETNKQMRCLQVDGLEEWLMGKQIQMFDRIITCPTKKYTRTTSNPRANKSFFKHHLLAKQCLALKKFKSQNAQDLSCLQKQAVLHLLIVYLYKNF